MKRANLIKRSAAIAMVPALAPLAPLAQAVKPLAIIGLDLGEFAEEPGEIVMIATGSKWLPDGILNVAQRAGIFQFRSMAVVSPNDPKLHAMKTLSNIISQMESNGFEIKMAPALEDALFAKYGEHITFTPYAALP